MSWDSSIDSAIRLLYISGIAVTFYRYCCSGVFDRPNTIHNGDFCVVESNPCQRKRCSHSHSSKGAAKVRRGSRSFRICLGAFIPPVMTNQSDISWSRTLFPSSNVLSYPPFRVAPDGLRSPRSRVPCGRRYPPWLRSIATPTWAKSRQHHEPPSRNSIGSDHLVCRSPGRPIGRSIAGGFVRAMLGRNPMGVAIGGGGGPLLSRLTLTQLSWVLVPCDTEYGIFLILTIEAACHLRNLFCVLDTTPPPCNFTVNGDSGERR